MRALYRHLATALIAAAAAVSTAPASAQSSATMSVGTIGADQTCTLYREYSGSSGLAITRGGIAAYSSWRSWLVKDCVNNFASLKLSLQAAFASAGGVKVAGAGGRYTVSGRISQVSGGGDRPTPNAPDGKSFAIATNKMSVNMDVTVRDGSGKIVFGGLLTKTIEVGSDIKADGFETSSNTSGEAAYTRLQHEVAEAVARMVVFHFAPLKATPIEGKSVRLNYGAPLIKLGSTLQVTDASGQPIMLRVVTATAGAATAEINGDGALSDFAPGGSVATYLEADDPAANGRRFRKVELP